MHARHQATAVLSGPVIVVITVGLLTLGLFQPAWAEGDSVAITSPADDSNVYVSGQPDDVSTSADPIVVTFTASAGPAACALDAQPAVPCTSPVSYDHLVYGPHTVTVTAGSATATTHFTLYTVLLGEPPVEPQTTGRIHQRWLVNARRTWVRRLELRNLGKKAHVRLTCRGRSCPRRVLYSRTVSDHANLTAALRDHALRPGTRLTIRVAKSRFETKSFVVTTRRRAWPTLAIS